MALLASALIATVDPQFVSAVSRYPKDAAPTDLQAASERLTKAEKKRARKNAQRARLASAPETKGEQG